MWLLITYPSIVIGKNTFDKNIYELNLIYLSVKRLFLTEETLKKEQHPDQVFILQ